MRSILVALLACAASGSVVAGGTNVAAAHRRAADAQIISTSSLLNFWENADSPNPAPALDFKVIGGTVQTKNLPWFANILVVEEQTADGARTSQCAGSLISPNYVLTAAHCFYDAVTEKFLKPRNYTFDGEEVPNVILQIGGLLDDLFQTSEVVKGIKKRSVKRHAVKVICSPKFSEYKFVADACILKLNAPVKAETVKLNFVTETRTVKQVEANVKPSTVVTAYGFGSVRSGGHSSPFLLKANLLVLPAADCQKAWKPLGVNYATLQESTICVNSKPRDTCQGDSGGPLMNDKQGLQVGVTSFGIDCASGIPSIYTNVAAYQPWIESVVPDLPPQ